MSVMSARTLQLFIRRKSDDALVGEEHLRLEPTDIDSLRAYAEQVEKLEQLRFFQSAQLPRLLTISCCRDYGLRLTFAEGDADDAYAALHVARPLLLDREPASFTRVMGTLGRCASGPLLREQLGRVRQRYVETSTSHLVGLTVGDISLFAPETFRLWLNSTQYHRDWNKRVQIAPIEAVIGDEPFFKLMLNHFIDKTDAVRELHTQWIAGILDRFEMEARAA